MHVVLHLKLSKAADGRAAGSHAGQTLRKTLGRLKDAGRARRCACARWRATTRRSS
jgi:hypothetical protein